MVPRQVHCAEDEDSKIKMASLFWVGFNTCQTYGREAVLRVQTCT
jgi:hypothetical protein